MGKGKSVGLTLPSFEAIEAPVPLSRPSGLGRIDAVEVRDNRLHRRAEAVEIEPIEADLAHRVRVGIVPCPQPRNEREDVLVAPHPGRESLEAA